ncbi:MAG: aspartate/glutamate racemase family protein [Acetobacteraceae bacterium]|nr:aspartate/glutamate racemase family protein [Acetobacteraceae bacterium]MDW8397761.1 aspartate/glutamate racemase family protein [Acetobacteraceae bacterium]
MTAGPLEYAQAGLVGVLTPQANATAETELSVLLPPDVGMIAGRFTCPAPDLKARLIAYFERLEEAIAQFADAPMDAIGVACTGASYLLDEQPAAFRRPWDGPMPVVSAAAAIEAALRSLGARRIAMLSPYPRWLTDLCTAYWQKQGFAIPLLREPAPVEAGYHPIYAQRSRQATAVLADIASLEVDAVLISGTGLPSLAALPRLNAAGGPPVISSNLALAWALEEIIAGRGGAPRPISAWLAPDAPWVARLRARYPRALA